MIKIYLSKGSLEDGREYVMQHISNPKKLQNIKDVLNQIRTFTFGEKLFYKWQPNLAEFDNLKVTKIKINEKDLENYSLETISEFDHEKENEPLEVLMSEGVARDKKVVVFQYVSDPGKLRSREIREVLNQIRSEKFPGKEMVKQPNIQNFEWKPVIRLVFNGSDSEAKLSYIPKFHQKPKDGFYKAPKVRINLASSSGQATLLTTALGDLIEDKEAFYEKVLRKVN